MNQWFDREVEKYEEQQKVKLSDEEKAEKRKLFFQFSIKLAHAMHRNNVTEVKYVNKGNKGKKGLWKQFFDPLIEEEKWALHAAPITTNGDEEHWKFWHKSLQEYFVSRGDIEMLDKSASSDDSQGRSLRLDQMVTNMNQRLEERSMILFRADAVNEKPKYKARLFEILELSKTDASIAIAAANAITALNAAGVSFSGMDLSGVRISGADLRGGMFRKGKF